MGNINFTMKKRDGKTVKFNTELSIYEVVLKDQAVFFEIIWSHLMVDVTSYPAVMFEVHEPQNCMVDLMGADAQFLEPALSPRAQLIVNVIEPRRKVWAYQNVF